MTDRYMENLINRGSEVIGPFGSINVQDIFDWIFETEKFLIANNMMVGDLEKYIISAKIHGNTLHDCNKIVAILKTKIDSISVPPIKKRTQIFIAMWFSEEMHHYYDDVYTPVINGLNYSAFRIDKKEFNGPITSEIFTEISNSVALIADLTGNRGGVYYEAGIAKGLSLCNHPIQVIFTCKKEYFNNPNYKPHFDVSVDNTIVYVDEDDLKVKLKRRLEETLGGL